MRFNVPPRIVSLAEKDNPVASVGTLKNGYPRLQALSQDKERGVYPRTTT
jgi:hypothetical protein